MSAFDLDDPAPSLDFYLIRDGSLSLFWSPMVLRGVCDQLAELGYHVVRIDADGWTKPSDLYDAIAVALDFPDYFGRNLDALNDCLSDVATGDYGVPAEAAGLALVLSGFDAFSRREREVAEALADIFATQSRFALLFGRRMLCLLQSADPNFGMPPVGGTRVPWNPAERANADRGL